MQHIDFKVQHQTITRTDKYEVVGNSQNYLYARFVFCEEWEGLTQTAVFSTNSGKHYSALIVDGECLVPWEVLCGPEFWVGVFAGDRITTSTARVLVKPGVKLNAGPGMNPSPTAYETLVAAVKESADAAAYSAEEAAAAVGAVEEIYTAANGAAERAEKAEQAIEGMKVEVKTLEPGTDATVEKGIDGDVVKLLLGIPRGEIGVSIADIALSSRNVDTSGREISRTYTITLTNRETIEYTVYNGEKGDSGISATHEWDGTKLIITSASGTSSADLKGEKGDSGVAAPLGGFFTLSVDEDGNLWVHAESDDVPSFEYDETTGNLYIVQEE